MDFNSVSYRMHEDHYKNFDDVKVRTSWTKKDTVDYWRHERMYRNLDAFISKYPNSRWLTVGDGRYGTDANYLICKGIKDVVATDISDTNLKLSLQEKFITKYKVENAEDLSFENESFDFVLCKESYHHFPRPMVALYEMLRVASKGVILIEPQDTNILIPSRFGYNTMFKWLVQVIKNTVKSLLGKEIYYSYGGYEPSGNYVYSISERELEKVALGLNLEAVSFKEINDHYIYGGEFEKASEDSEIFRRVKKTIDTSDRLMKRGINPGGILIAVIHKKLPTQECIREMNKIGFTTRILPRNPYVNE